MNQAELTNILQQPQTVTKTQTEDLKTIINSFPYFQSARAVYLKGLKNSESFKYNQTLKITAAYTTDRSILFDFITSDAFKQNEISQFIKQNTSHLKDIDVTVQDISVNNTITLDSDLKQQFEDTKDIIFDPSLFQPKTEENQDSTLETTSIIKAEEKRLKTETPTPSEILNLGKPLEFNKTETHSFNEWLNLTSLKPIKRENVKESKNDKEAVEDNKTENTTLTRHKKFELIEQFISKNPKLEAPKKGSSHHNIAKAQMIQPEALMTETLARIYVEQKNYKKAIQSYKILSLKYPEKSGFFADQIKAVKQLQEQNNTK
ncbi:hypothetical protein [Pontimicrobium sp. MEBiC06410]